MTVTVFSIIIVITMITVTTPPQSTFKRFHTHTSLKYEHAHI